MSSNVMSRRLLRAAIFAAIFGLLCFFLGKSPDGRSGQILVCGLLAGVYGYLYTIKRLYFLLLLTAGGLGCLGWYLFDGVGTFAIAIIILIVMGCIACHPLREREPPPEG